MECGEVQQCKDLLDSFLCFDTILPFKQGFALTVPAAGGLNNLVSLNTGYSEVSLEKYLLKSFENDKVLQKYSAGLQLNFWHVVYVEVQKCHQ